MTMLRSLAGLLSGLMFGAGLCVSGMMDPHKVQGFLDIGGAWDPSLAGVMAGAILVMAVFSRLAAARGHAITGGIIPPLSGAPIDARLLSGAAIFGIGWGLAGLCPGPALALVPGGGPVIVFVAAMAGGMVLAGRFVKG